jgi:hypothetical protein
MSEITTIGIPQYDRERHGSLYDRGSADAYYSRNATPHWYPDGSYNGDVVTDLDQEEIAEYMRGYDECTDRKDWGE